MLPMVLFFGVLQLAAAYGCFVLARKNGAGMATASLLGGIGFFLVLPALMSPFLFFQYFILLAVGVTCHLKRARGRTFLVAGALASVVLVGVLGAVWLGRWAPLRSRYPIESVAARLAYEERDAEVLADATDNFGAPRKVPAHSLRELDEFYERSSGSWGARRRTEALQLVHGSQVAQFIASEGFGVGRGVGPAIRTIELPIERPLIEMPPRQQPSVADNGSSESATSLPVPLVHTPNQPQLVTLHSGALMDFVNPRGFGYVKDREHVVGFESHRFKEPPETCSQPWRTYRVELVSLLKHERPMVYVSDHLPAMSELQNAPVRALDEFEQRVLAALRSGQEIETESTAHRIRMVGAIRAAKQCLVCHTVKHGALLGAFSYEFRPAVAEPAPMPGKPAAAAVTQQAASAR